MEESIIKLAIINSSDLDVLHFVMFEEGMASDCCMYYVLKEIVVSCCLISDHTYWCNPGLGSGLRWEQQRGSAESVAASAF